MSRFLCMHCWRLSAAADLLVDCPECTAATPSVPAWMADPGSQPADRRRPARRRTPSWKRAWLGDADDGDAGGLGCERHPDARVTLCCACGAGLPERAELPDGRPLGLGFAGPRSAGKTLLLLTMVRELRQGAEDAGFGLSGIGDTEQRFGELSASLFRDRRKPAATAPETPLPTADNPNSFCWQVMADDQGKRSRSLLLGIYDLSGETWGEPSHRAFDRFDRYLGLLGSLTFVVDGAPVAADLGLPADDAWDAAPRSRGDQGAADHQWLASVIDRLGQRSRQVDLALTVSKADLVWQSDAWADLRRDGGDPLAEERQARLLELLAASGRRDLWVTARHHFRQVRLFAVSSLGFRPQQDDVDGDRRLARPPEPRGVTEPLAWLLERALPALRRRVG